MAHAAWIALGSNLGDRQAHLDAALSRLGSESGVTLGAVSSYHDTAPVGGPSGQKSFLNGAAGLVTTLSPRELLGRLHAIEDSEGRIRTDRWGARTLDLDLLLWEDQIIVPEPERGCTLAVPHPWLPFRRFVLAPFAEIAPTAVDPITGLSVAALLANLDRRPSWIAIDDAREDWSNALHQQLVTALAARSIASPSGRVPESLPEPFRREQWFVSNCGHLQVDPEIGDDVLRPTFVVRAGPVEAPNSRGTPRLHVDPLDLAAALEKVLAACAAARS